ncbi:hypothetical protein [Streptomyces griseosporeus]|uniref:hypothetical protein n=1 Tax=Streptomyces griseosporeus TaxID=1910 RepID=UPI0036F90D59
MTGPLVVNTQDGTCWTRRGARRNGEDLYAPEGVCDCPPYVMATLAELAEHGIAGSTDVLPVPIGQPEQHGRRARIAELIGEVKPASDGLLEQLAESVRDRREHDHPTWEDLYCLNLVSFMGERMGTVLRRLLDAEARAERYRIAWGMARTRAVSTGGAADRYAARARDAQEVLQRMLFTVIAGQLALHEANRERQELRARVAELEAERHSTNEALTEAVEALAANRDRLAESADVQLPVPAAGVPVTAREIVRNVLLLHYAGTPNPALVVDTLLRNAWAEEQAAQAAAAEGGER